MFAFGPEAVGGGKSIVVNTGPIGCGAFSNDDIVVYVLQALAAGTRFVKRRRIRAEILGRRYRARGRGDQNLVKDIKNARPKTLLDLVKECVKAFSHL